MKQIKLTVFAAIAATGLFFACNSEQKNDETNGTTTDTTATTTTTTLEQTNTAPKETKEITIHVTGNTMADMKYDQAEITVPANSHVKITLINDAKDLAMQHNFVLVKQGDEQPVATDAMKQAANGFVPQGDSRVLGTTPLAKPGETVTGEFDAPAAGQYTFICTYPGHYPKMQGKFIVQ